MFEMWHIAVRTPDGLIHVQNYVGIYRGQHHVHTEAGFRNWNSQHEVPVKVSEGHCHGCELKAGDVEEYDGRRWHNDRFEKAMNDAC